MKMNLYRAFTAACALAGLTAAAIAGQPSSKQQDLKLGLVAITLPPGWTTRAQGNATWLVPPDLRKGQAAMVIVSPPEKLESTLQQRLDQIWAGTKGKALEKAEPRNVSLADEGIDLTMTSATIQGDKPSYVMLTLVGAGDKSQVILFLAEDKDSFERHQPAVLTMLQGMHRAPDPAATTRPAAAVPKSYEGLYVGFNSALKPNLFGGGFRMVMAHSYLQLRDGMVSKFSLDGLRHYEAGDSRISPESSVYAGKYSVQDNKLAVQWSDGSSFTAILDPKTGQTAISLKGTVYHYLPSCAGLRMQGKYYVNKDRPDLYIAFSSDGTFAERDFLGKSTAKTKPPVRRGDYEFRAHTLVLRFADKTTTSYFLWISNPEIQSNPPTAIVVNEAVLDLAKPESE